MPKPQYGQDVIDSLTPSPVPPHFGQVIVDDPDSTNGGNGGGVTDTWELISSTTVLVAASQVDITGLDGDVDELYALYVIGEKTAGGANNYAVRFNGDSGTNYDSQALSAIGVTVSSFRTTGENQVGISPASAIAGRQGSETIIFAKSGGNRHIVARDGGPSGGGISIRLQAGQWLNTVDNITEMNIIATNPSDLAVGSQIFLFKKVSS